MVASSGGVQARSSSAQQQGSNSTGNASSTNNNNGVPWSERLGPARRGEEAEKGAADHDKGVFVC